MRAVFVSMFSILTEVSLIIYNIEYLMTPVGSPLLS